MLESLKKLNFDYIVGKVRQITREYPVEILTCLTAYILLVFFEGTMSYNLQLMPLVFGAAYAVNNFARSGFIPKTVYYATALFIVLAAAVDAHDFVMSQAYGFGLLLSAMFLVLSDRGNSDGDVSLTFIKVAKAAIIAPVVSLALTLAVTTVFYSTKYIFGIEGGDQLLEDIVKFLLTVIMPCTFLISVSSAEGNDIIKTKLADIICNYILGSTIIIFTAILYAYMAKIAVTVTLPLGGLTAIITVFYIYAFLWLLFQEKIDNKYYRWFYRFFGYISLPVIVMFFIGLIYRINEYGFTESRVYMTIAGIEMLTGSLVLIFAKKNRFKIILYTAAALIVLSTYIPYISAKDIGLRCQTERLVTLAQKAGAYDESTGKLMYLKTIDEDNADAYEQMTSAYKYLQYYHSAEYMEKTYGKINTAIPKDTTGYNYVNYEYGEYIDRYPDLGDYHYVVTDDYSVSINDGRIMATAGDVTFFDVEFKIPDGKPTEDCFIYRTDEYMLVLNNFSRSKYNDSKISYSTYSYTLFKKSSNKINISDEEK